MITRRVPEQAQEPGIESRNGSGMSSGHHLDACLWVYSGKVQLGGNPDSERTRGITHPTWWGQATGSHRNTLRVVTRGKNVSTTLLSLHTLQPCPHKNQKMDGIATCVCTILHLHFLPMYRQTETSTVRILCAQWEWALLSMFSLIHHLEVCLCVYVSLCVSGRDW